MRMKDISILDTRILSSITMLRNQNYSRIQGLIQLNLGMNVWSTLLNNKGSMYFVWDSFPNYKNPERVGLNKDLVSDIRDSHLVFGEDKV